MAIRKNIGELSREGRKKRKIRPTILIISEGKDTEVNYFKECNGKYVNVDIKLADKASVGKNKSRKTDPINLVEKAIDCIETKYDIAEADGDRVWCLIDVDLNYNNANPIENRIDEIQKAYKKAKSFEKNKNTSINLGISNPCFEIWYLLHYIYTTANFKAYNDVKNRIEKDTPLKDYEKSRNVYNIVHENTQLAIRNCDKLKNHHEAMGKTLIEYNKKSFNLDINNVVRSNPFTNVNDLVKYIELLNHSTQ